MKNKSVLILIFLTLSLSGFSQSFDEILKMIEDNNPEIQASEKNLKSKVYEYKSENLPSGPSFSYGYFPDNSTVSGIKTTVGISQAFQMPWYYTNQATYTKLRINREEISQKIVRQEILFQAKQQLIEYIYLSKRMAIVDKRLKFAQDIYNAYMIRLETGDANMLEVNKAKLHLMQVKKAEKNSRNRLLAIKENLKYLNGGNSLDISVNNYPVNPVIELDSLLFSKLESDPEIRYNQKAFEVANRRIKLTRSLQFPELSLGYGSETVGNESFKGIVVGVSIPLWNSRRLMQQSKLEADYFNLKNSNTQNAKISETKVTYDKVRTLNENLESYQNILASVNSEDLLKKSLDSGEISVIEFFTEMFYYYEVYDDFLIVEKEYYEALSELYKYKL